MNGIHNILKSVIVVSENEDSIVLVMIEGFKDQKSIKEDNTRKKEHSSGGSYSKDQFRYFRCQIKGVRITMHSI